jgi:hypothetical protein
MLRGNQLSSLGSYERVRCACGRVYKGGEGTDDGNVGLRGRRRRSSLIYIYIFILLHLCNIPLTMKVSIVLTFVASVVGAPIAQSSYDDYGTLVC